jgi:hypothetical protein
MQIPIEPERPAHVVLLDIFLEIDKMVHLVLRPLSRKAAGTT